MAFCELLFLNKLKEKMNRNKYWVEKEGKRSRLFESVRDSKKLGRLSRTKIKRYEQALLCLIKNIYFIFAIYPLQIKNK